jgi:hypothetical protein
VPQYQDGGAWEIVLSPEEVPVAPHVHSARTEVGHASPGFVVFGGGPGPHRARMEIPRDGNWTDRPAESIITTGGVEGTRPALAHSNAPPFVALHICQKD